MRLSLAIAQLELAVFLSSFGPLGPARRAKRRDNIAEAWRSAEHVLIDHVLTDRVAIESA
jgi:hypothetical protein